MKAIKTFGLGLALTGLLGVVANADTSDKWLTTKTKIVLLTTDGLSVSGVNVDSTNGAVTLHGKVKTEADRVKAENTVRGVDGVKSVKNLLQVVPEAFKKSVKASDKAIKDRVEASLKSDKTVADVKVASVNNGVVLLSGKAASLTEKLRAIELAWTVGGVTRVASEIETDTK